MREVNIHNLSQEINRSKRNKDMCISDDEFNKSNMHYVQDEVKEQKSCNVAFNRYKAKFFNENGYALEKYDEAKTKMLKYIFYKKRTENEIRTKFKKDYSQDIIDDAITELKKLGYINDTNYVERFVREYMALKSLSRKELRYKLMSKGIKNNDIDLYFSENSEELNEYELLSAMKIVNRKKNSTEDIEIKQFLLKKGYTSDNIKLAMSF